MSVLNNLRKKVSIHDSFIIKFPKIVDPRGNLTFIEQNRHIPFKIAKVRWVYDVPGGEQGRGHALRTQEQCIIALSGGFDVLLDDGSSQKIVHLNRAYYGLYIPGMIWQRMQNFSTNAVAYVLSSDSGNEDDSIRDFKRYETLMKEKFE